jgi:methionine synthase I (cobalamin-dependent)
MKSRRLLFDGGMGSELIARGLGSDEASESWNESHPEEIREIHRAYFSAGADVVETNTFGGTSIRLRDRGLEARARALNHAGAELALSVKPDRRFVAGSIGPTGKLLKPLGESEEADFISAFREQAEALSRGGCDLLLVETMYDIQEAFCALRAAREACALPVGVTLTFERKKSGFFTVMGNSVKDFLETFEPEDVAFLGANCTLGSDEMVELARELRGSTKRPLLIQPNAGRPVLEGDLVRYPIEPGAFVGHIEQILDLGVDMVGGCCGTSPAYIREMHKLFQEQ